MRNNISVYLSTLCITVFACCKTSKENYPEYNNMFNQFVNSKDTTIVPIQPDSSYIKFYYRAKKWSEKFNLVKNDSDFELRAWVGVLGLSRTQKVIVLRKNTFGFSAQLFKFDRTVDSMGINSDSLINVESKTVTPKSGWLKFTKSLFFPGFLSLFNLNQDYGEPGGIDSDGYYLEIISKDHYWISDFWDPYENHSNAIDVINTRKVFDILKREFL